MNGRKAKKLRKMGRNLSRNHCSLIEYKEEN